MTHDPDISHPTFYAYISSLSKGGKNVTQDPDVSSPAWMRVDVKDVGSLIVTQNYTNVDVTIGDVRIQVKGFKTRISFSRSSYKVDVNVQKSVQTF